MTITIITLGDLNSFESWDEVKTMKKSSMKLEKMKLYKRDEGRNKKKLN